MKKKYCQKISILGLLFLVSCGPSIDEQIKVKKEELKKLTDSYNEKIQKSIDASKQSSESMDFYYRLQIAGANESDSECIKAKKQADRYSEISDSLSEVADQFKKSKLDIIYKEIDDLMKQR